MLLSASKQLSAALETCDLAPLELLFANDITIHAGKRTGMRLCHILHDISPVVYLACI